MTKDKKSSACFNDTFDEGIVRRGRAWNTTNVQLRVQVELRRRMLACAGKVLIIEQILDEVCDL